MLKVENLTIGFNENQVLKNLNFSLAKGESLGIVGESGSGKSITALAVMGLLPSSAKILCGQIHLTLPQENSSTDLIAISEKEHRAVRGKLIAMVFQEPMTSLNPSMLCGRQVVESICLHQGISARNAKTVCLNLLKEMQLPYPEKVFKSYPHELSGGQKQRVMIAIALAGKPEILIADEPTTALDVTVQKEIILLLKNLISSRGLSLIFISHDLGLIRQISNRLLILKDGIKVEEGSTTDLFQHPKHPYTKGLMLCRPGMGDRPEKLITVSDFIEDDDAAEKINTINADEWISINKAIYSKKPILHVENVTVEYILKRNWVGKPARSFRAVNRVTFNLFPGETLGLVGESGCGKTSLGRAVLGLNEPVDGSIVYLDKDISTMTTAEEQEFRKDVQLIFQDPYSSLNPRHTVGQTLMEPLRVHGLVQGAANRKKRVFELLKQVSLPEESFYRYPHEFSGGQRQRIAIARALALRPKIIVCDEMVSALDVSVQAQILNLLNELKREFGLTYIFISHDLSVVKYMSNRILVMNSGNMVEYGDSDAVYSNPQSEYTKKLIDSIPSAERKF